MAKDSAPVDRPAQLGRFVLTYVAPDGSEVSAETEVPPRFSAPEAVRNLVSALEAAGIYDA